MNNRNGSTTAGTLDERFDEIKDNVKNLVDQGQEKAQALKERALEVKDEAISRGTDLLETVTEKIRANPLKSVAIAFGIGYVGMRIFR